MLYVIFFAPVNFLPAFKTVLAYFFTNNRCSAFRTFDLWWKVPAPFHVSTTFSATNVSLYFLWLRFKKRNVIIIFHFSFSLSPFSYYNPAFSNNLPISEIFVFWLYSKEISPFLSFLNIILLVTVQVLPENSILRNLVE